MFKNLDECLGIVAETSERHKLRKPVGQEEFQNPPYEHHDKYVEGHATENLALRVELSRHRIPELHQLPPGKRPFARWQNPICVFMAHYLYERPPN